MKIVVFLGPSLPVEEARGILDAVYLPPAGQADVVSALRVYRPDVIGIVDGLFARGLSVWHKEILFALSEGVHVYGASSMGALRAAECSSFGMVGVGAIYQAYASGAIRGDDEVALLHGDEESGYRRITEPLVNVRATLAHARVEGLIDDTEIRRILELAEKIFYQERTFPVLFRRAAEAGVPPETLAALTRFLPGGYVDRKREDTVALLAALAALPPDLPAFEPCFLFQSSHHFEALYHRDRWTLRGGMRVPLDDVGDHFALHAPDFGAVNASALNRAAAVFLAHTLGIEATAEEVAEESRRLRLRLRISRDGLPAWRAENDLGPRELDALMEEAVLCRKVHAWLTMRAGPVRNRKALLDELRLTGRYADAVAQAADHLAARAEAPDDTSDVTPTDLMMAHLRETNCRPDRPMIEWSEDAGFLTPADMLYDLAGCHVVRERRRKR